MNTTCRHGHDRATHTKVSRQGYKFCGECARIANRAWHRKVRGTITPREEKQPAPVSAVPCEPWRAAYEDGRAVRAKFDAKRQAQMEEWRARYRAEREAIPDHDPKVMRFVEHSLRYSEANAA